MRQPAFILLLISFTLTQYSRHLAYVECQVTNYWRADGPACDCEKTLIADEPDSGSIPLAHHHIHPDENYVPPSYTICESVCPGFRKKQPIHPSSMLVDGFSASPDRPPCS